MSRAPTPSTDTPSNHAAGQHVEVFRVSCSGPGDLRGVQALVDAGTLDPRRIVAVMGKTEGNGCVNDYTREYAAAAWCHFLAPHLGCTAAEAEQRVALVMSGGTEGVLSPHFTVFTRGPAADVPSHGEKRLVVGIAHTRDFTPEEIGRTAQIDATSDAVRAAMADAGIADAADVHFVQVKCPLLTSAKVLGEAARSTSALRIAHSVMRDAVDAASVRRLLRDAFGLDADTDSAAIDQRLVNLLAKAEASPDGRVRGARHTMLNDSDINATRHARAAVGGVLASVVGNTALYVSGGAEHQGPAGGHSRRTPGGGPVLDGHRAGHL